MDDRYVAFNQRRATRRALLASTAGLAVASKMRQGVAAQKGASASATSDTGAGDGRERLRDMLALVPQDVLLSPADGGLHFDWLDYQRQFAALGVDDPYDRSVEIVRYTMPLASNDPLFMHAMTEEIEELLGFLPFNVHQVLVAGTPPEMYSLYRGGVEFSSLTDIWEASDYALVSSAHGEYWSTSPDASVDFDNPLHRFVLARMNNMAIIDDDTLVCAPTAPMIERVLELHATGGESAADSEMIVPLVDAMPAETVNVMAFPGGTFSRAGVIPPNITPSALEALDRLFEESDEAIGPMPPLLSALAGVTAGVMAPPRNGEDDAGMSDATAFMSFLAASEDDAVQAANTAFWRIDNLESLNTGEPYTDLLEVTNVAREAANGPVMTVELGAGSAMRGVWHRLVMNRDLLPFAW